MSALFLSRIALTAALAISIPAAAAAQDETVTPEGTTWHLTAYAGDGMASVPFYAKATLLLENGTASGSTGCNTFTGTYAIDDRSLSFDPELTMTRAACPDESLADLENGYLAVLPMVATWSVEGEVLRLTDADGVRLLEYEEPVVSLTRSAMADIMGLLDDQQQEIARAELRIDNIRIGTLRNRIKELEATVETLQAQAAAAAASSSATGSAFTAREKVLLKAIPRKVEQTCRPLRSGLPRGTVAAVACDGVRKAVAEMAYYLMEWDDAEATLESVARANGAPNRQPRCDRQRAGWISYGTQIGAEACWTAQGKGNYRLVTRAAACHQLDVAGTLLREPAIYLAIEGKSNKMEPLRAAGLAYTDASYYLMNFEVGGDIPHGKQPRTPTCRTINDTAL